MRKEEITKRIMPEIERCHPLYVSLYCWRLKFKDITLTTKLHTVRYVIFPVVYRNIGEWKAEIDALNCVAGALILRIIWTTRKIKSFSTR